MECKQNENKSTCNCTYPCSRNGKCCECLSYHRERGELPACYFPNDYEQTYNRSIRDLVKLYHERGAWWEKAKT